MVATVVHVFRLIGLTAARRRTALCAAAMTNFKDSEILDSLAQTYYDTTDFSSAVETEQKALDVLSAPGRGPSGGASAQQEYTAKLTKFKERLKRR